MMYSHQQLPPNNNELNTMIRKGSPKQQDQYPKKVLQGQIIVGSSNRAKSSSNIPS